MVLCCLCSPDLFTDIFASFADTCWRRDTGSESDEEPLPAKRQRTTDFQIDRTGDKHGGGQHFKIKMTGVICLRGMERGDTFKLAKNVTDFGNFGDLVYTRNGRQYFLHLKHADSPGTNKLMHSELVPLLHACFETYCNITNKDQSEFIIYTNQHLDSRFLNYKTVESDEDKIFKTSEKGKIFQSTSDDNKENDVHTLLEESMTKTREYKCLSDQEKESQLKRIKEFLNKLIIFTGQKDQWELDDLIVEEIRNQDKTQVHHEVYTSILRHFKMRLENWWRNGKEKITPETHRNWLQEAKTKACAPDVRSFFEISTKKLVRTGINYSGSEILRLEKEISNRHAVHLRSDALTLCSILLLDCLPQSKSIFVNFDSLQNDKNLLLHAWLGGNWEWLIVFCDSTVRQSDISDTFSDIFRHIAAVSSMKYLIILTACSVQQIESFFTIDHKFKFEQLSHESQETVLDKQIYFQGCEVTMRSVLLRHGNVEDVLGPELVTDLMTEGTAVNMGGRLPMNTGCYAPRLLERQIYLNLDVLEKSDSYPNIFAVSGIEKKVLVETVPSFESVEEFYLEKDPETREWVESYNKFKMSRFILLRSKHLRLCFRKLCEKHSGKTLHWLQFKNGSLLWKESHGSTDSLINYVDFERTRGDERIITEFMKRGSCEVKEDSVWDLGERTVLVVAEPGKGNSNATIQVAWDTKLTDPTSWVVRINWYVHCRKLQEINVATFNFDSLVKFLCSAAFPESKYTDIERILFKHALQNSGNVTVLMDGFDDISPIYADKADVIVSELMKTKVERVWVTSRPVHKERLEKELSVAALNVKKISQESQKKKPSNDLVPDYVPVKKKMLLSVQESQKKKLPNASKSNYLPVHTKILRPLLISQKKNLLKHRKSCYQQRILVLRILRAMRKRHGRYDFLPQIQLSQGNVRYETGDKLITALRSVITRREMSRSSTGRRK